MPTALNMTLPLKQDFQSQRKLEELKANFPNGIQQAIDAALKKSTIVHFARVLVIENKYIQVLTEFDGDKKVYALFFLRELPTVFQAIFELAEGVPSWEDLSASEDLFYEVSQSFNIRGLGKKDDDPSAGWLFSAFGNTSVKEIGLALKKP